MIYSEKVINLFDVSDDHFLVQCISSDFEMGLGLASEFNSRYDLRNKIIEYYRKKPWAGTGYCLVVPSTNVLNLVTKDKYWMKPTYKTIRMALDSAKMYCLSKGISKLAMPLLGSGLDELSWDRVSIIVKEVFNDSDIEILVCKKPVFKRVINPHNLNQH